jgi:hypothetical protein
VQIGIRLLLPLVALLWLALAASAVRTIASLGVGWRRRGLLAGMAAAVALLAMDAASIWPHGLAYVSPLWGGARDGYRLVSDSNYDWGQGVPELAEWQQRSSADLAVWYFGTDPAFRRLPFTEVPLHQLPVAGWDDLHRHLKGRSYLAVSTTLLHGCAMNADHRRAAALLRQLTPVGRTTTFLIYDLDQPAAAEFAHR